MCKSFVRSLFTALQRDVLSLRGSQHQARARQKGVSGRQEKRVGQPEVQFRRPGQSVDVFVRAVVQRRVGEHHVHGTGRRGSGPTGKPRLTL